MYSKREIRRMIQASDSKQKFTHPDFIATRDDNCEHRLKPYEFKMCRRKARVLVRVPALAGYPEFSVQLCKPCAKQAEKDWRAELVIGRSVTELLSKAESGAAFADVLESTLKGGRR